MDILLETYHLVHDLSKNEKGYFKRLNGSNKRSSKLIKAFDLFTARSTFNKAELQRDLKEEGIAQNVVRDLMESVLRSLSLFNSGNSVTFKLNLMLSHVETLFTKKRFKLCHIYVERGMKLSQDRDQETYALQFSFWKRRLEGLLAIPLAPDLDEWTALDTKNLQLIEDKMKLHHLGGIQTRVLMSKISTEAVGDKLEEEVLSDPILRSDYKEESLENLFLHNGIKIRCLLIAGDLENALADCLTLFNKIKDLEFEGRMISNYFVLRLNIMRLQAFLKHFDNYTANRLELEELLKSKLYTDNIRSLKPVIYPSFPVIHCAYLANKGETEYLINYYKAFVKNPEYVSSVDSLTEIEVGLLHAWSLFVSKKFSDCFKRISKLNADFDLKAFQKLNSLAKWLELMACYEMRDETLFQSRSNSLQRYLQSAESSQVERLLISHLNSSFPKVDRAQDFRKLVEAKDMDLRKLRMAFSFIDISSWLQYKSNRTLI